jgi:hypothetical protein
MGKKERRGQAFEKLRRRPIFRAQADSCFLRGPRGEILDLHPDSTAQVRFLWEEW